MDIVEQRVTDKPESAYMFVFGDKPPPETATVADPMEMQVCRETLITEMGNCIKPLAREIDRLDSER